MEPTLDEEARRKDVALHQRIRRLARKQEMTVKRRRFVWYFGNYSNRLVSPETGLNDNEAIEFLMS
jgi:hypothetical protein